MNETNLLYLSLGLSGLLLLAVIWLVIRVTKLNQVRKEFFSSGIKKDLEQILVEQNRSISIINKDIRQIEKEIAQGQKDNTQNFQKIGFIRFNPFDDAGGNISFALALLNSHNDGFVLSSLHGRDGTRVYAKVVRSGLSESQLTEEEVEAIKKAK
ncbi:MAG: hypothetical protein A3I07_04075 [Candidatus Doudnabacteria bacterium RIFCSPLOWO2_02_FULL_42_9]|uniref:DUF4446 domain-containing protein n=1 Tax=Candidatus Doudnabacteria bacterium RIFCSPHIGHO2_01_FULL_41_86 TaxID=1817821 RepID=A0A1F5N8W5_9BACT|nr:MAG: hypothetical protein A2717_00345 [Candidatus Doudnabacteria bacterium RIFCSPHIGHO2_01_FULL_41_86]OGE75177.1 MAG: hypothetical protein A3K07_01705 [Candidatus Doudnabacteria bacterium RIFCSPHIGHO2_01_43_10]OGE86398.1 MAG: hypothetical protein A3E28_00220 [Candidatus Doudnabacteria bacterium RIFCSPHIGHO2_12_FULL_42_22]OGE87397.1 MAG: hypothetical protein A3C49_04205 [Candidatus Doudnabacteria bacterium RIFCSPHIGHO2_02_FULL_42_25]OGE92695.1 MAG: hypothetical protein A2895_03700 [Candidatus